ncbi:hypothetical protein [Rhizobium sp. 21-4511-3d]
MPGLKTSLLGRTSLPISLRGIDAARKQGGGVAPDPLLPYQTYDAFTSNGNIAGRTPDKGPGNWQTYADPLHSGQAALPVASGGVMKMSSAGDGNPAYGMLPLGAVPSQFHCTFIAGSAGSQPPVMGCLPDSSPGTIDFSDLKLLHMYLSTNGMDPQLGNMAFFGDTAANHPFQWRGVQQTFSTPTPGNLYDFDVFLDPPSGWVIMELRDHASGNLLATAQCNDLMLPTVTGGYGFWELFNTTMFYDVVWTKVAQTIQVPSGFNPAIRTYFASDPGLAIIDSPFAGGTHTYVGAGDYKITSAAAMGSGVCVRSGAVVNGKHTKLCVDVKTMTGNWITAVVPPPERPGGLLSNYVQLTLGRNIVDLTHSGSDAGGVTVLGGLGDGAGEIHLNGLFVINDGPVIQALTNG